MQRKHVFRVITRLFGKYHVRKQGHCILQCPYFPPRNAYYFYDKCMENCTLHVNSGGSELFVLFFIKIPKKLKYYQDECT